MKKLCSVLLVGAKMSLFFCLSGMGWFVVSPTVIAADHKNPCHQESSFYKEANTKDCGQCKQSLIALIQDLIGSDMVKIVDVGVFVGEKVFFLVEIAPFKQSNSTVVYRPPPEVIWANAMYSPKKTIVLVI